MQLCSEFVKRVINYVTSVQDNWRNFQYHTKNYNRRRTNCDKHIADIIR